MSPIFFALALFLVVLLVYVGRFSSRVRAEATRFIAAPPEAVQARIADLGQWQAWNPWLEHARNAVAALDGRTLSWDVPAVGRARVTAVQPLRQQMAFELPFKFRGRSDWQLTPAVGGTQVRWSFKGRVSFMLRAFSATVQGATALDLRFGLDRLAATLQDGPADYTLHYLGVQPQPARCYAQQPYSGPLDTLAAEVPQRFVALREQLAGAGLPSDGAATVHYLKTHLKRRTVDCRIGLALPAAAELPVGLRLHEQPELTAYVLHFDGTPEALELAWYRAMQRLRVEQRQPHPLLPPYAVYQGQTQAGQPGVVELHLPVKT